MELLIDNEPLDIPKELTIGIYQQLNINPERYKNPLQIISLITGLSLHDLKNLQKEQIELIEAVVSKVVQYPEGDKLIMTFVHEGVEYGLENDWSKLAWGAWVDFEVYCSDEKLYENLHKIMAILYRPVIWKDEKKLKYKIVPYRSEEIEDRAEIMKSVPVNIWLGAALFFLEIVKIYIDNTKASLELKTKIAMRTTKYWMMMPKWLKKVLPLDFILPSLTASQKRILQGLKK